MSARAFQLTACWHSKMTKKFDFLIIGSGIAGLSFALKLAQKFPLAKLALVTKADENESNTKYAQGGIAVVTDDEDSFRQHIQDTLIAGDGLCDPEVVAFVVAEGPARLKELLQWEVEFDKNIIGEFERGLEGGHTGHRILHHKDKTGFEIELKLLRQVAKLPNILVFKKHLAIALLGNENTTSSTDKNQPKRCWGAYVLHTETGEITPFEAPQTMLATGGIGHIYANTTNPSIATGDGVAMAANMGAEICDIEFIQFHPTALFHPEMKPAFLISEAVRGHGAFLRNKFGHRFMVDKHPLAELAPRDIVARAIDLELKNSKENCVYLDCTHLDAVDFVAHFPMISKTLEALSINPATQLIPVVPAAHYSCGGIAVNAYGQSTIKGLYATGECARTGLHGANRLASNSLLEALVFSHRSFLKAAHTYETENLEVPGIQTWQSVTDLQLEKTDLYAKYQNEIRLLMNDFVGIVRTDARLNVAAERLAVLEEKLSEISENSAVNAESVVTKNMLTVAQLVVQASLARTQNAGTFFKETDGVIQKPRHL